MDPFRKNSEIELAKASLSITHNNSSTTRTNNILSTSHPHNNTPHSSSHIEDRIPTVAPPAYHTITGPNMPMSNITSPYDSLLQEGVDSNPHETSDDDTPEIIINAATQIRGHGNIISIAQMDSVRIANLISAVLSGQDPTDSTANTNKPEGEDNTTARPPTPITPTRREHTSTTQVRGVKRFSNINITVNCGATIIGDRNIVGPGLGDIARQMQIAQRNQAALLAQQRAAAAAVGLGGQGQGVKLQSPPQEAHSLGQQMHGGAIPPRGVTIPLGVATPPMSRSSSLSSEAGRRKRKSEDGAEGVAQKRRC
ncbi:hypothetical protein IG631_16826 [Alternaria alternata]|nr:hypothetical protein IG631_16826 [Alternaria alternata]